MMKIKDVYYDIILNRKAWFVHESIDHILSRALSIILIITIYVFVLNYYIGYLLTHYSCIISVVGVLITYGLIYVNKAVQISSWHDPVIKEDIQHLQNMQKKHEMETLLESETQVQEQPQCLIESETHVQEQLQCLIDTQLHNELQTPQMTNIINQSHLKLPCKYKCGKTFTHRSNRSTHENHRCKLRK